MFKLGQKVIWNGNDNHTLSRVIKSGVVTKVGKDTVWVDSQHKPEDQIYAAFCYPDIPECRQLCQDVIDTATRHDAENKKLLTRQLKLSNEMVRQGLK